MEVTGRVTAHAQVTKLKDNRQVVNFSVAVNDSYRPKGSDDVKKVTTYFNCSYWINPGIAEYLKKGMLVEVSGRISVNAWTSAEGEAKASLNFHVDKLKLHGKAHTATTPPAPVAESDSAAKDDLPF